MPPDILTRCAAPSLGVCVVVVADATPVSVNSSASHPTDLEAARQGQISGDTL